MNICDHDRDRPARVLFVCLGNICRSPLAEAALRREAERLGLDVEVDSAGTGEWHVGRPPDPRTCAEAARQGIDIAHYRARQVHPEDFHRFTHIYALDAENLADLLALAPPDSTAKLGLLLDVVEGRQGEPVADPYHGPQEAFDATWREVEAAARALAQKLAGPDGG